MMADYAPTRRWPNDEQSKTRGKKNWTSAFAERPAYFYPSAYSKEASVVAI